MKEILLSLFKNARKTYTQIGKEIGKDRSNVKKLINKMEDENIIWTYAPIVDVRKLGYKTFILLAKYDAKANNEVIAKSLRKELKAHELTFDDAVLYIDSILCNGPYDFIAKIVTKDIIDARNVVDKLKATYPGYIAYIDILEVILPSRVCGKVNPELDKDIGKVLKY